MSKRQKKTKEQLIAANMEEARERAFKTIEYYKANDITRAKHMEKLFKQTLSNLEREIRYQLSPDRLALSGVTAQEYSDFLIKLNAVSNSLPNFSAMTKQELDMFRLTANVSRLEYVKAQIALDIAEMYGEVERYFEQELNREYQQTIDKINGTYFNQQVMPNFTTGYAGINLQAVVNADYYGAKWFQRLYKHNKLLTSRLDAILTQAMLNGQNPTAVSNKFAKEFGISNRAARDLLITEASRVNARAQKDQLEYLQMEEYEYVAEMDQKTCDVCGGMNGKRYKVKDMEPGINCHPMHTRCRCTTVGVYKGSDELLERIKNLP